MTPTEALFEAVALVQQKQESVNPCVHAFLGSLDSGVSQSIQSATRRPQKSGLT